jgi:ribosomal protein L44E
VAKVHVDDAEDAFMPNPRLTPDQLAQANQLLKFIRDQLDTLSGGNRELRFALNRKVAKELGYDERSKPGTRRKLKILKRIEQRGRCAICPDDLPARGAVLDRFKAIEGYTGANTRLICAKCDVEVQTERKFT